MNAFPQIRVACFGDSHTRCIYGYDWVKQLSVELRELGVEFGRFGVNGELAYHATKRLQSIVDFRPDLTVVLLGSNDVNAVSTEKFTRLYMGKGDLPQVPDEAFFVESMGQIIDCIQKSTTSQIALVTIPLLGEHLDSRVNCLVESYNRRLLELSITRQLRVLDLNAEMRRALKASPLKRFRGHYDGKILMRISLLRHRLLFQSWDRVARANGLYLLTDTIHLNERSGRLLAGLVKKYVLEELNAR